MKRHMVARIRAWTDDTLLTHIRNIENLIISRIRLSSDDVAIIKKNLELKNMYVGKRCFVLGNGPSLDTEDLTQLKAEYVFTVNQCMRRKDFKKIKTNFHFWADPVFYSSDMTKAENLEMLNIFKQVTRFS